jgi:RNA polymerase sigma-70 factor (ECF subfamily)
MPVYDGRVEAVTAELAIVDEAVTLARTDEDVLERAVREHARLVYRIAYSVLRNGTEAEDVVQEVFLRALRHGKKLQEVEDPKAWLARIAWRVAVEERRRTMRDAGRQPMRDSEDGELPEGDAQHSADSGAELALLGKERGELLHTMISGLPDALRDPLVLSALEELSSREIGTVLGISEAAVRSRAFRARQILRERMTARMGVGG